MLIDVFIAGFAIFLVASVVHYTVFKKREENGCMGGCGSCPHSAYCHTENQEHTPNMKGL